MPNPGCSKPEHKSPELYRNGRCVHCQRESRARYQARLREARRRLRELEG